MGFAILGRRLGLGRNELRPNLAAWEGRAAAPALRGTHHHHPLLLSMGKPGECLAVCQPGTSGWTHLSRPDGPGSSRDKGPTTGLFRPSSRSRSLPYPALASANQKSGLTALRHATKTHCPPPRAGLLQLHETPFQLPRPMTTMPSPANRPPQISCRSKRQRSTCSRPSHRLPDSHHGCAQLVVLVCQAFW